MQLRTPKGVRSQTNFPSAQQKAKKHNNQCPPFYRQFLTCLYRQSLFLTKSPTAYGVIFIVPIFLVGSMAIIQQLIFRNSEIVNIAQKQNLNFDRVIPTKMPTCDTVPYDYLLKPCVDLSYFIDSKLDTHMVANATKMIEIYAELVNATRLVKYDNYTLFKQGISDISRGTDTIAAFSLRRNLGKVQYILHHSLMRYGAKLTPAMTFRLVDMQTDYLIPFSENLFSAYHKAYNGVEVHPKFTVQAWPNEPYNGYQPITYFIGMLSTLSMTSVLLLLTTILLDDLSHPCTSLYAFLSVSVVARIASWFVISLLIATAQPFVLYCMGVLFSIPSYSEVAFKLGFLPIFVLTLSIIPVSLLIAISVTPNIRNPSLPTTQPIVTATYIIGLLAILTMIILAPLASTAIKVADVHRSLSELQSREIPFSIEFVGYFLRLINVAIGVALCSLGVSEGFSVQGVAFNELRWLGIDSLWMMLLACGILAIQLDLIKFTKKKSEIATDNVIEIEQLTKTYSKTCTALSDINFTVQKDEKIFILGNAAAGKSTLLHVINGIERKFKGSLKKDGVIGFVSQYNTLWNTLTVENHIQLVLLVSGKKFSETIKVLQKVGLEDFPNRLSKDLSFGMKRRLCLGMALAVNPDILILDEVSSGVDPVSKMLIHKVVQSQKCVLMATHDLHEAEKLSTRIIFISKGQIIEEGNIESLYTKNNVKYTLEIFIEDNTDIQLLEEKCQRTINDLGFGRFSCEIQNLNEYQQCSERLKGLEGVVDCRLKPPSMDLLFKHLCGE
ncbi:ABC transporter family protein [Spironucleus salmonicida]|uniref:ABC transporter family protein n=1 Tax=Spironucleus salmonicida TaxID=348837 RepID=V6M4G5_9EUKA|nr:ABC transporter family protein [Spironucleus salmonicida]|eukprot:EST48209.1 ABC transporter family protein [Spironucleus salmonicida]